MSKEEFVAKFLKDQTARKKERERNLISYQVDAGIRMKRIYRGNLLRPSLGGR